MDTVQAFNAEFFRDRLPLALRDQAKFDWNQKYLKRTKLDAIVDKTQPAFVALVLFVFAIGASWNIIYQLILQDVLPGKDLSQAQLNQIILDHWPMVILASLVPILLTWAAWVIVWKKFMFVLDQRDQRHRSQALSLSREETQALISQMEIENTETRQDLLNLLVNPHIFDQHKARAMVHLLLNWLALQGDAEEAYALAQFAKSHDLNDAYKTVLNIAKDKGSKTAAKDLSNPFIISLNLHSCFWLVVGLFFGALIG